MAQTPNDAETARAADIHQARGLLRAARMATLATQAAGQPFTALVTPATAPDLSILLLLSSLSEHTRHLRAEPRCALLVAGAPDGPNPQTAPRLTVTGLAEPAPDPALRARWLALHPYAAPYADFADFALWRIQPYGGLFVGGFARATRLRRADLVPDPAATARIAAAASDIIAHCNAEHAGAMAELAATPLAAALGAWRMVAVDVDGCDLAPTEDTSAPVHRVPWSAPVSDSDGVRGELIALLRGLRLPRG